MFEAIGMRIHIQNRAAESGAASGGSCPARCPWTPMQSVVAPLASMLAAIEMRIMKARRYSDNTAT